MYEHEHEHEYRGGGGRREKGRGGVFRFAHCGVLVRYGMVWYGIGVSGTDAFLGMNDCPGRGSEW